MRARVVEVVSSKGVAGFNVAGLEAPQEPGLTLFTGAVGPDLRIHLPGGRFLDPDIADSRRG